MHIPEKKANLYQFIQLIEKYKITGKNIYNFDKRGFMIDMGIIAAWVITYKELKSSEIIGLN